MLIFASFITIYKQAAFVTIYQSPVFNERVRFLQTLKKMMSSKKLMNNPVVILDNITLNLTDEVIAEIATGLEQVDGLVLETNPENFTATPAVTPAAATPAAAAATPAADTPAAVTPAAVTPAAASNDDDWFRAGPSSRATPGRLSSGRKNMKALLKSLRSPSPIPSTISTQSTQSSVADEEDDEDSNEYLKFLEEEQRRRNEEEERRAEWARRSAGQRKVVEKKWARSREVISSLTGEGKRLKKQREALIAQHRAQMRALDDEEADLEKRKRSAVMSERKYGSIMAKYREMNL